MIDLKMPSAMAELGPAVGEIVSQGQAQASYFATLLSSKHGLQITAHNREERVEVLCGFRKRPEPIKQAAAKLSG